jgi:molecular chaperone GrpE
VSRDSEDIEGTEDEPDGPSIAASDELEAALREAELSVDETRKQARVPQPLEADSGSPDKLTIELLSGELQSLKEEFEARGKELEEAAERQVRLQAEFENFRRRNLKERQESLQYGQQNLVKDLLTSVDNLDRAIEHSEQNADADFQSLLQGIDLVKRDLLAALGKHGVSMIEAAQQPFDPTYHEAMGQVPDASVAPNTVVAVLQKGYLLHDRMLRPARVMVAREPTAEEAAKTGQ